MPRWLSIKLAGRHGRCLAALCFGEAVGTVLDKLLDAPWVALDQSPMQGRKPLLIGGMYARTPAQEDIDARREALVCSPHQRRVSKAVEDVNGDALMQEEHDQQNIAVERGDVKGVVALGIGD